MNTNHELRAAMEAFENRYDTETLSIQLPTGARVLVDTFQGTTFIHIDPQSTAVRVLVNGHEVYA